MLSQNIYNLRKEKNISQEEFANILNTSRQAVSKWERGEAYPDIDKLKDIANFFNVSIDYLLDYNVEDSTVDKFITKLQEYETNKVFTIKLEDIKLWISKYNNNFDLYSAVIDYLFAYLIESNDKSIVDLIMTYLNKSITLLPSSNNHNITLNDIHSLIAKLYVHDEKYDLAKEYIIKNNIHHEELTLARCNFELGNYKDAINITSEVYLNSVSSIINGGFLQIQILLINNNVKEAYNYINWSISFIKSILTKEGFFSHIIYLYNILKAICEKLLNLDYNSTINYLKNNNIENNPTEDNTDNIKFYYGMKHVLFSDSKNTKETVKQNFIDKLDKSKEPYKVSLNIYNQIFGGDLNE